MPLLLICLFLHAIIAYIADMTLLFMMPFGSSEKPHPHCTVPEWYYHSTLFHYVQSMHGTVYLKVNNNACYKNT